MFTIPIEKRTSNVKKTSSLQRYQQFRSTNSKNGQSVNYFEVPDSATVEDISDPTSDFTTGDNLAKLVLLKQPIQLRREAFPFLMRIEGHTKNLFYFILDIKLESDLLEFSWTKRDRQLFIDWCLINKSKAPSGASIDLGFKTLRSENIIQNLKPRMWMVNPIIVNAEKAKASANLIKYSTIGLEKIARQIGTVKNYVARHMFPKSTGKKTSGSKSKVIPLTPSPILKAS
jgi:hypothetical protein